jgi:hypothetical protein
VGQAESTKNIVATGLDNLIAGMSGVGIVAIDENEYGNVLYSIEID